MHQLHYTRHGLLQHTLGQCNNIRSHIQTLKTLYQNSDILWIPSPSHPLLEQLNWLPLPERVKYKQSQLVYKAVNGLAPDYMCALFTPISNISTRTTRSNERGDLYVPKARTNVFKNSIAVNGAHIWNERDPIIRNSNSLSVFKTTYMHHVFN